MSNDGNELLFRVSQDSSHMNDSSLGDLYLDLYEDRVEIHREDSFAGMRTFRYEQIIAARVKEGPFRADLYLEMSGDEQSAGMYHFKKLDKSNATTAKELIEQRRSQPPRGDDVSKSEPAVQSTNIPEQIRKLAELRDSGALSDEEFEAKKADLLDRM